MSRLKEKFKSEITPSLMGKFNYQSVMQVPNIEKIVINMGVGDAVSNSKALDTAVEELTLIAGQKPVITKAKNQSQASVCVKVCLSERRLHYVENVCINSLIS